MGNSKGAYMAPENTAFSFTLPVEGEALFLLDIGLFGSFTLGPTPKLLWLRTPRV